MRKLQNKCNFNYTQLLMLRVLSRVVNARAKCAGDLKFKFRGDQNMRRTDCKQFVTTSNIYVAVLPWISDASTRYTLRRNTTIGKGSAISITVLIQNKKYTT